jgi:hypothetical protein
MEWKITAALVLVAALSVWAGIHLVHPISGWRRRGGRLRVSQDQGPSALSAIDLALTSSADQRASLSSAPADAGRGTQTSRMRFARAPAASASVLVTRWAKGRMCVWCGGALTESRFMGHHIALLEPGGMTREWVDVATDRLPLALATSLPLCWNCHVAATFRRVHPELVTDREDGSIHSDRA